MVPVSSFRLLLRTNPPPIAGGPGFDGALEITFSNGTQRVINFTSPAEFTAAAALLQVPGQLFFVENGAELIKQG